ncbi:MAG: alkaline phosphatase D family protein [Pseudomonadota bacterium]
MINRRNFVCAAGAWLAGCHSFRPLHDPTEPVFSLGVASGDPDHESVVLWTRVAPDPFAEPVERVIPVSWELASDEGFRSVISSGLVQARPENAHCVHVLADGLAPGSRYFYRFRALGLESRAGRTRTLPAPGAPLERFRLALTSCQEYSAGYFTAYKDLTDKQPDLVLHNGDYIYESAAGSVRDYPIGWEAFSLADYRALYAQYRQDADLREAHARFPWMIVWDDHEVANDWGPDHFIASPYNRDVSIDVHRRRIRTARRAFLEHMPLRASLSLYDGRERVFYQRRVVGDLLEISYLDVRSYRSPPVCNTGVAWEFDRCAALNDPARSMLGQTQEQWLYANFAASGARWNCLAQATAMAPFDRAAGAATLYETDSWDNYPANRARIVEHVRRSGIGNAISLGGNIHAFYAGYVTDSFAATACAAPSLTEIVTSSITADGGGDERFLDVRERRGENPCIEFFENRRRGYTLLTADHRDMVAECRVVDQIEKPGGTLSTLARFGVRNGRLRVDR